MKMTFRYCGRVAASASLLLSLIASAYAGYADVSGSMGISYKHSEKGDGVNNHAGAAALDVNGDTLPDLIFARFAKAPLLYVNQGGGAFADETAARGLTGAVDAAGFGAADFDNDGDQDIYMTVHEGSRFYLYINEGTGQFTEQAVERGAALAVAELDHKGYSVGIVDYNLDGFLDIYVSEWGVGRSGEQALHSALLKNEGSSNPGHFVVATEEAGIVQPVKTNEQSGFSSAWADFDGDGWPDLSLIADYGKSQMYWNDGDGSFTNSTATSGVGFDENGMGVAVADYNGDGLLDFYVTSIFDAYSFGKDGSHTGNKLYRNNGGRNFQEVSVAVGPNGGVSRAGWGWGAAFLEFDNDGDFDLVTTNGHNQSEGGNRDTTPYVDAATDPTKLFLNNGNGTFADHTAQSGISDTRYGKAIVVLDWDADGDEDVVVVNSFSDPIFYESDASENGNDWLRLTFEGTVSNRDAIGTRVRLTDGGKTQTLYYNPSNAYIGQREMALHFGLGDSDGTVDSLEVRWPTGFTQIITNPEVLAVNRTLHLLEPEDGLIPPLLTKQPSIVGALTFGDPLALEVSATGDPEPLFVWEKDGKAIAGATGNRFRIKRLAPFDEGEYRARAINAGGEVTSSAVTVELVIDIEAHSVARWWNEFMMEAIRRDFPDPTKHSRTLYHTSAAMWDAFWAYEEEGWSRAKPVFHEEVVSEQHWGGDRQSAQREAISHAAYAVLKYRYAASPGSARSEYGFRWLLEQFGFDPDDLSIEGMSPAAVGNRIGAAALEGNFDDGANEPGKYVDTSGYESVNEPLVLELPGAEVSDINRWQPLAFDFAVSQNGIPIGALVQSFLGVNWRAVETFAMKKTGPTTISFDPGPPPQMGGEREDEFVDSAVEVIRYSSYLDPAVETTIDISPGTSLNNPLGTNAGTGYGVNPYTGDPYAPNVVKLADYGRILAEFWADGPASETPPGHWNTLHNEITEHPLFVRKYMGVGEALSPLEWDVRAYLTLNGGMHDAAVAAWTLKRQYDYSRPITMIRGLAGRGQSSDPGADSYDPEGIPLIPGLIELVTEASSAEGERHVALADSVGEIAIRAWAGEPEDSHAEVGGVDWILAENWFPYQRSTFVSPAFAAYVSGHSTFSRTGAEIMTLLTGTPFFPGGIGTFTFPKGEFLEFEYGPSEDVRLEWATYYDAADQAGLSRLYGGIHVRADDFIGRTLGARIGVEAFLRAHQQRNAASGTGLIREVRLERSLGSDRDTVLATFETEGESLPVARVQSLGDSGYGEQNGIYLVVPDSGSLPSEELAIAGVGPMKRARIEASLQQGDTLSVVIRIDATEPVVVLARGQGESLGHGVVDTSLAVWTLDENGADAALVDANDDWRTRVTNSLSEVLILRERETNPMEDSDAALAVALPSGTYRFALASVEGAGRVALVVSGEGWRE